MAIDKQATWFAWQNPNWDGNAITTEGASTGAGGALVPTPEEREAEVLAAKIQGRKDTDAYLREQEAQQAYTDNFRNTQSHKWADYHYGEYLKQANDAQTNGRGTNSYARTDYLNKAVNNGNPVAQITATELYDRNARSADYDKVQADIAAYKDYMNAADEAEGFKQKAVQNQYGDADGVIAKAERDAAEARKNAEEIADSLKRNYGITTNGLRVDTDAFNTAYFDEALKAAKTAEASKPIDTIGMLTGTSMDYMDASTTDMLKSASEDDKVLYAYLLEQDKKNGTNIAPAFQVWLKDNQARARGAVKAEEIENMDEGLGKVLAYGGRAVGSGLTGALNDVRDSITGEQGARSINEYAAEQLRQGLVDDNRKGAALFFDAAQSVGAMAPGLVASTVTMNPVVGAAVFATTTGASSYQDKLDEGWTQSDAMAYGTLTAIAEGSLQYALGGISKLGKNVVKAIAAKMGGKLNIPQLAKNIVSAYTNKPLFRAVANATGRGGSEGFEEFAQTYIEPAIVSLIQGTEYDTPEFREALRNGLMGTMTSLGLGGGDFINDLRNSQPTQSVDNAPSVEGGEITPPAPQKAEQAASDELNSQLKPGAEVAGQKNNALEGEESTSVNDNPATHTPEEMKKIEEYKGAVDTKLVDYVQSIQNNPDEKRRFEFKPVSDRAAAKIKELTGVDVTGNKTVIERRGIEHIIKDHGENGITDHSMQDVNDIARIQYILDNYDNMEHAGTSSAYVTVKPNGKHGKAQTVRLSKAINGTFYVVEAVPDTSKKTVYVVSAYITKKPADLSSVNAEASRVTSENAATISTGNKALPNSNASNASINATTPEVNTSAQINSPPKTVPTQSRFLEQLFNEDERQIEGLTEEDFTHEQRHDTAVNAEADQRINSEGVAKVQAELNNKPADQWNDTDVVTAQKLLDSEVTEARSLDGEAAAKAYAEIAKLAKAYRESGTEQGRAMRQRRGFDNSVAGITALAAETLYGENVSTRKKLKPQRKSEIMNQVADLATRYNNIAQGDIDGIISMIKEVNEVRGTTGLFSKETSKTMNWALEQAKTFPDGEQFLSEVLSTQIKSIAGDYVTPSVSDSVKSYRFLSMLSKISTVARNLVSNGVLDGMEMFSNNITVPLDVFLSQFTGTRSTTVERGILSSEAKRKGTTEGMVRSMIQVGLDADLSDAPTKYDQRAGRNFKMTGNFLERFLSTWEKYENYALKTADEAAKGGIAAEKQRGIDALLAAGKVQEGALSERAKNVALERTLQNDTQLSKFALKARDAANDLAHVGSIGAGDLLMPFAKIPANAVSMSAAYTPAGVVSSATKLVDVLKAAKDGTLTAEQQAEFVQSFGRALTGAGLTAVSMFLGAAGVIKAVDDEDKDKAAAEKSAGQNGVQINLDAFTRVLSGNSAEWQAGDKLLNVGFLQPINANLTMGLALADAYNSDEEITLKTAANLNLEALAKSILDFPAVSQIKNMADNFKYSGKENIGGKIGDAALGFAGDVAGSFVPNAVRGIAAGTDPYIRDIYSGKTPVQQAVDNIKAGIPGLRETLPVAIDSWGNPKMQMAGAGLNFLNQNILPGAVNVYQPNAMMPELKRLTEAGITGLYPDRNAPGKISDTELSYEDKQQYLKTANSLENKLYNEAVNSGFYKGLTDEQKGEWLKDIQSYAEAVADTAFRESKGIKTAEPSDVEKLLQGVDKPGESNDVPALKEENALEYLLFSSQYSKLPGKRDYAGIDALLSNFDRFDGNTKDVITNKSFSNLSGLLKFKNSGSNAETYYTVKDAVGEKQWDMDVNSSAGSHVRLAGLASADIPNEEKDKLVNSDAFELSKTGKAAYEILRSHNLSPEIASAFLEYADWSQSAGKEGKTDGRLTAYEVATALSKLPGLSENEKSRIFAEFKSAIQNPDDAHDTWKNRSYTQALRQSTNYGRRVGNNEALEALLAAAGLN